MYSGSINIQIIFTFFDNSIIILKLFLINEKIVKPLIFYSLR